ncbi:MAG TPA: M56 family metallopeptidase [Thermoanaerobaculia bacterium]
MSRVLELHLLFASIVWIAAWLLTSMPRVSATAKYWIWVATAFNFVLPLSALPARWWPSRVGWFVAPLGVEGVSRNLAGVWIAGALVMFVRLVWRLRRVGPAGGPAVVGFVRPEIHLPADIDALLTRDELDAVLIHERRHAARRDNLICLAHEVALCLLWFHPLVWLTRTRLALYRELSCDEAAIRRGRGEELVAALGKIAHCDAALFQAGASSFVRDRVAHFAAARTASRATTALIAIAFGVVLSIAIVSPIAQAAAAYTCALAHGLAR